MFRRPDGVVLPAALASDSGKLEAGQRVDNSFTLVRFITCTGEKKPGRSPFFSLPIRLTILVPVVTL